MYTDTQTQTWTDTDEGWTHMLNFDFYIAPETFGMNFGDAYMQWEVGFRTRIFFSHEAEEKEMPFCRVAKSLDQPFTQDSSCSYSILLSFWSLGSFKIICSRSWHENEKKLKWDWKLYYSMTHWLCECLPSQLTSQRVGPNVKVSVTSLLKQKDDKACYRDHHSNQKQTLEEVQRC